VQPSNEEHAIRLDQFLKLANLVRSGGEAKHLIQSGHVLLNGAVETRRSRKIRPGDQVTLDDVTVEVAWEDEDPS
jgi:ribosome-associated protein